MKNQIIEFRRVVILRNLCAAVSFVLCAGTAQAYHSDGATACNFGNERTLFTSVRGQYYRIPALAVTRSGAIIALSDDRHNTGYDVGQGGKLDVLMRRSLDGGNTWTEPVKLADSDRFPAIKGFGDASIVADCKSDRVLALVVSDSVGLTWVQNGKLGVYRFYSNDGGETWDGGMCITDQIYGLGKNWKSLFISSGRIMQSRVIKTGKYYRIYCVALVRAEKEDGKTGLYGNAVLYSDDFGETWSVLGNPDVSPCPRGDEAKIEEYPDGTVILSSRTNGRFFNLFAYYDKQFASGVWTESVAASSFSNIGNACNGEILRVEAIETATGRKADLLLQSVPAGPGRSNVSIYYKVLKEGDISTYTTDDLGSGWIRFPVCSVASGYSTMCRLPDGKIAFLYERIPVDTDYAYDIVFRSFSLDFITGGKYRAVPENRKAARRFARACSVR